jgi:Mg-chelatase subunit ChlI
MSLYPFAAVVGMERAKCSLLLHAVDPRIGGTLLLGQRGCAKSTLVRGFAALLPKLGGLPAPFVDVPLGVSEDRLLGAVHGETLLRTGAWLAQAGLLEKANEGVLYVDEINLLPDALSDLLLDSAASGIHRQERDGLSQVLHSRYILIGTMNPEEGDLRPQLSDRFAHGVRIEDSFSALERVEIGRRRLAFDDDPAAFEKEWAPATERLNTRLQEARQRLLSVQVPDALRLALAERAQKAGLEGMRAELAPRTTAARCPASAIPETSPNFQPGHLVLPCRCPAFLLAFDAQRRSTQPYSPAPHAKASHPLAAAPSFPEPSSHCPHGSHFPSSHEQTRKRSGLVAGLCGGFFETRLGARRRRLDMGAF